MKKLFMILLAILGIAVAIIVEKGTCLPLLAGSVIIPLCLGVLFTTMFSYHFKEIVNTFKSAFSEEANPAEKREYQKNQLIVKNLQNAVLSWSYTILILAVVQILCDLSTPEKLGPSLAAAFSALFYGFFLKAALLIPMEHSLNKKIFLVEEGSEITNN